VAGPRHWFDASVSKDTNNALENQPQGSRPQLAVIALLIVITSAYIYFTHDFRKPSNTAFIVPSQSVQW
jgi:hypothetical protein